MCIRNNFSCLFDVQEPTEELELKYLSSGPSLALGLLRVNAVMRLLELMGPEDPVEARTIDQTLWRAQYGSERLDNGIYGQHSDKNNQPLKSGQSSQTLFVHSCAGSPSYRKAVEDIKLVFPEGVCCTETSVTRHEKVL